MQESLDKLRSSLDLSNKILAAKKRAKWEYIDNEEHMIGAKLAILAFRNVEVGPITCNITDEILHE
jgi:hypothetical protein